MTASKTFLSGDKLNLERINGLIVDDNQQSLDILASICSGFGMRNITKRDSAEDAQKALQRAVFDFVLTDAQMPGMNGYDFVTWLRREGGETNRFAPVIMITGHTRVSQVERARDCGAHFTIAKPVTPKILLERIFWIVRDDRPIIECDAYCGPERRFKREGPPGGGKGRRHDDLSADVGDAVDDNLSQEEINALMKPAKVSL